MSCDRVDCPFCKVERVRELIAKLGHHPSFTLPPVSEFVKQLKEIVGE